MPLYTYSGSMQDEAWRTVSVIEDSTGEPHVLQQKVAVYTAGATEESAGYTGRRND